MRLKERGRLFFVVRCCPLCHVHFLFLAKESQFGTVFVLLLAAYSEAGISELCGKVQTLVKATRILVVRARTMLEIALNDQVPVLTAGSLFLLCCCDVQRSSLPFEVLAQESSTAQTQVRSDRRCNQGNHKKLSVLDKIVDEKEQKDEKNKNR